MTVDRGVLEHWPALVRAARAVLGSGEDAEDCAATAIAQFFERSPRDVDNLEAYLVTLTKRRAWDLLRSRDRERRRQERLLAQACSHETDVADTVVGRAEAEWMDRRAEQLLRPAAYGVLRGVADGTAIGDVARDLGLTRRAAESHLLRARKTMRAAIGRGLVVVGVGWAAVRRGVGHGPVLPAVPAACLAFVIVAGPLPAGGNVLTPVAPVDLRQQQSLGAQVVERPAGPAAASSLRPSGGGPGRARPREVTVGSAPSLAGADARVTRGSTGQHETGPVEVLEHCLRDLRVDLGQISCSGPERS